MNREMFSYFSVANVLVVLFIGYRMNFRLEKYDLIVPLASFPNRGEFN